MPTHCSATGMAFGRAGGRELVAEFDGGRVTSEAESQVDVVTLPLDGTGLVERGLRRQHQQAQQRAQERKAAHHHIMPLEGPARWG